MPPQYAAGHLRGGKQASEHFLKLGGIDRLGEKAVHAGLLAGALAGFQRIGGERDDRHAGTAALFLDGPDRARCLDPVHAGHMNVGQKQVETAHSPWRRRRRCRS